MLAICTHFLVTMKLNFLSWPTSGTPKFTSKTSTSSARSSPLPYYSEKSSESLPTPRSEHEILPSPHVKAFTLSELKNATRNFRADSLLGEGGFGYVYKGWIDETTLTAAKPGSGMVVAVKKLKPEGFQGHKEWLVRSSSSSSLLAMLQGRIIPQRNTLLMNIWKHGTPSF